MFLVCGEMLRCFCWVVRSPTKDFATLTYLSLVVVVVVVATVAEMCLEYEMKMWIRTNVMSPISLAQLDV